ncbi:aromatic hydrocarbon degradation protein [Flavobacterium aquariorum]|uniref:Aromatic hydrocarbon degradation protein n=1 Tax=Flavobacterium aquariorum TaxID=2217670 RepID=A0A2W7TVY7_9FLAO|nr:aromatic hydrocarbon degradation protein [Flavobacterium aquariorum]PZX93566.1 aromatic hydrocarbon degradation protein [Flavobacterium aquariorum]
MKKSCPFLVLVFFSSFIAYSQSIATSPYSLYGLGSLYEANFGLIPSLGTAGIALPSDNFINNKNAASLVNIPANNFFFEVGGKGIQSSFEDNLKKENRNNFQFSHFAFAFPINNKSAVSVAMMPYSSSSFKISGLKIPILDSSNEYYYLDVMGTGGLNNLDFSYAYRLSNKLSLGFSASVLFGNTTDERTYTINGSVTSIDKKVSYSGIRPILGSQFKMNQSLTFGLNVKSPTRVNATKIQSVTVVNGTGTSTLETDEKSNTDDFYLPLEVGVGFNKAFKNKLNIAFDYEKRFWDATNQSDMYGNFSNQEKFALGLSYQKAKASRSYFDRIKYAAGVNYDTGYLEVDNKKIEDKNFSIGASLPLDHLSSALFISYTYGQKGQITNSLVQENYHKLTLNLNLDGIWFVRRKLE